MKLFLYRSIVCVVMLGSAPAFAAPAFVRNDNASDTINSENLFTGSAAVTAKGGLQIVYNKNAQTNDSQGLLKSEDSAHSDAEAGVLILSRRIDTLANSAGTTGDLATINQNVNGAIYVQEVGGPANGGLLYNRISAATNNSTSIKSGASQVYSVSACNVNAAVRWLKVYNSAAAPTCGTDVPVMRFALPPNNCIDATFPTGAGLGSGLGICIVTGAADTDNTATAANEQTVQISYK